MGKWATVPDLSVQVMASVSAATVVNVVRVRGFVNLASAAQSVVLSVYDGTAGVSSGVPLVVAAGLGTTPVTLPQPGLQLVSAGGAAGAGPTMVVHMNGVPLAPGIGVLYEPGP